MGPPETTVVRFNDAINARELGALVVLMTEDHRFVDSAGGTVEGKAACTEAWRGFFDAHPDYQNHVERVRSAGPDVVEVTGRSSCSVPELDGPCRWRAVVRDGRIAEWRIVPPREDPP